MKLQRPAVTCDVFSEKHQAECWLDKGEREAWPASCKLLCSIALDVSLLLLIIRDSCVFVFNLSLKGDELNEINVFRCTFVLMFVVYFIIFFFLVFPNTLVQAAACAPGVTATPGRSSRWPCVRTVKETKVTKS